MAEETAKANSPERERVKTRVINIRTARKAGNQLEEIFLDSTTLAMGMKIRLILHLPEGNFPLIEVI